MTDRGQRDVRQAARRDPRDSVPAEGLTAREVTEEMAVRKEDQGRTEEMTDAKTAREATEGTTGVTAVRIEAAALETARTASPERTHPFPHLLWRDRNPREPKEKERMTTRRKITAAMKTRG